MRPAVDDGGSVIGYLIEVAQELQPDVPVKLELPRIDLIHYPIQYVLPRLGLLIQEVQKLIPADRPLDQTL